MIRFIVLLPLLLGLMIQSAFASQQVKFNTKGWSKHKSVIAYAAKHTDASVHELATFASIETTMGAAMRNKSSGASGLFQFTERTWRDQIKRNGKRYGIKPGTKRTNARANAILAGVYLEENRKYLERKLKRRVSIDELFMAHLLGTYGAERILKASNNKIAARVTAPGGNRGYFYNGGRARTVGEFKSYVARYVRSHAKVYSLAATQLEQRQSLQLAAR